MIIGILKSENIIVTRQQVRDSIHRVDPITTALKWLRANPRWKYSVRAPNALWHNDGLHKLVHVGFVVHACVDGYSRMITSLGVATNNRAETALHFFMDGVKLYGIPLRVRGDHGTEQSNRTLHEIDA